MQGKTVITIVLDESGSMLGTEDQVVSGFNEFILTQQDKALGDATVTLLKFNSTQGINFVFKDKPVEDVLKLTRADFHPQAVTPLYDAIAEGIKSTEDGFKTAVDVLNKLTGDKTKVPTPMVSMLIMTDGLENASLKYKRDDIFKMISERQKDGWAFVFLGSDMDSWAATEKLGYAHGNVRDYNKADTFGAFTGFSRVLSHHRTAYTQNLAANDVIGANNAVMMASTNFFDSGKKIKKERKKR